MARYKWGCLEQRACGPVEPLCVEALCANVGGHNVLHEVSLHIARGEIVGLLGRDGAGKTSCFEALAGLIPITSGRIYLNRLDITRWPIDYRARVGLAYLPEETSVFRGLTVEENILAALEASDIHPIDHQSDLENLLAEFHLLPLRGQIASTLSGGERRRCEVARAMALKPTVLLLDEPFRGLDPPSVESVKHLIRSLKTRHVGVLASDYDLHDLLEVTDRLYVLNAGHLIFQGSSQELLTDPDVRKVFLGDSFTL